MGHEQTGSAAVVVLAALHAAGSLLKIGVVPCRCLVGYLSRHIALLAAAGEPLVGLGGAGGVWAAGGRRAGVQGPRGAAVQGSVAVEALGAEADGAACPPADISTLFLL